MANFFEHNGHSLLNIGSFLMHGKKHAEVASSPSMLPGLARDVNGRGSCLLSIITRMELSYTVFSLSFAGSKQSNIKPAALTSGGKKTIILPVL